MHLPLLSEPRTDGTCFVLTRKRNSETQTSSNLRELNRRPSPTPTKSKIDQFETPLEYLEVQNSQLRVYFLDSKFHESKIRKTPLSKEALIVSGRLVHMLCFKCCGLQDISAGVQRTPPRNQNYDRLNADYAPASREKKLSPTRKVRFVIRAGSLDIRGSAWAAF